MPSHVVEIESGRLAGVASADRTVLSFKGVPYAQPPVGDLRWKAPRPPQPWSGIRSAEQFGPRSIQPDRPVTSISYFGPEIESEDCLTLNIWTGARGEDERRPVMVFFHGGAYRIGSGALPTFNGENLARARVVLVTVNFRLGPLGFMSHPELSRESEHASSGNYGLLDQIEALRWVRDNISAFGGDLNRVTIFGQSVGSSSVGILMASPLARGLFHRAIGQSGGSFAPAGRAGGGSLIYLDEAEGCGVALAKVLGAKSLRALRALPADVVQLGAPDKRETRSWPPIDGHAIPEPIHDTFFNNAQSMVPLITGSNSDEGSARPPVKSLAEFYTSATEEFGFPAGEMVDYYLGETKLPFGDASRLLGGHRSFNWQNWLWARLHARSAKAPVYYYHFSHNSPVPTDRVWNEKPAAQLGAFHTAELPFVFRNLSTRDWKWTEADYDLSKTMSSYWVNFASSGNPNGAALPEWSALNASRPRAMRFDGEATMGPVPDLEKLNRFDRFYATHAPTHAWTVKDRETASG